MEDCDRYKDTIIDVFAIRFNEGGWEQRGISIIIMDKQILFIQ